MDIMTRHFLSFDHSNHISGKVDYIKKDTQEVHLCYSVGPENMDWNVTFELAFLAILPRVLNLTMLTKILSISFAYF